MTINTKAATDEVYDLFNQPLKNPADHNADMSSDRDFDTETDDYTSAGDTMSMGRSCDASEAGDVDDIAETTGVSSWSDFSTRRHVPAHELETPDMTRSGDHTETQEVEVGRTQPQALAEDLVTPISEFSPQEASSRMKFVPVPPADYEPPQVLSKDPAEVAFNKLPFMTPIVEMTESSMGALTGKRNYAAKTPCRKAGQLPMIDSTQVTLLSPFQEMDENLRVPRRPAAADDLASLELAPFESPIKLNFDLPILPTNLLLNGETATGATADRPETREGPIIKDLQCNPVDESIKNLILDSAKPSLANYPGFNQYPYESAARAPEIRKYIKMLSKAASDRTISSSLNAPKLNFADSDRSYTVKRELGKGAFAPVYLVTSTEEDQESPDKRDSLASTASVSMSPYPRAELEALKMEDPPSAWEFYITRQAHTRLQSSPFPPSSTQAQLNARAADSLIHLHELHLYEDEAYLLMAYRSQGTLLDLVNMSKADSAASGNAVGAGAGVDEVLAMFFTVELLRTVEALHDVGILHGDLKADNCLVRFDPAAESEDDKEGAGEWAAQYSPTGADGWRSKGLTLIDLGRGIDMRAFSPDVRFIADWKTAAHDCAEMREMRPWTWQVDYHGVANVAHTLLFGRYIETVAVQEVGGAGGEDGGVKSGKRYRLAGSLKRYWQTEIWGGLFDLLLNPGRFAGEDGDGDGVRVREELRARRGEMEDWLVANCERGVGLRGLIRKLEGRLGRKK